MTDVALVAFYRARETWMNPADRDLRRRAGARNPDEITTNQERSTKHTHAKKGDQHGEGAAQQVGQVGGITKGSEVTEER